MKLKHKKVLNRLILATIIVLLIVVLSALKNNVFISEYVFARGLSRAYIYLLGNITSNFRFSLFEFILCFAVIFFIILLFRWGMLLSKKRRPAFFTSFLNTIIVVLLVLLIYTSTASFSYYRKELPVPQFTGEQLESDEIAPILEYYLIDFQKVSNAVERNEYGMVVLPYTDKELANIFIEEYKRIGSLNGYLSTYTPTFKNITLSKIMNYMQTSGIAITPTGEANVNKYSPTNWKIITIAHELAHIKGVMNENEANLLAYYLTLTSDNIYLKYAGYMYTIGRLFEVAYFSLDADAYSRLYDMFPIEAISEQHHELRFWLKYQTHFEKVSEFFNNLYLKLSGVEEGTDSYIDSSDYDVIIDTETGEVGYEIIEYSPVQKMYIALYLMAFC